MHYLIVYKDAMKYWKPRIYVWLLKCKCEIEMLSLLRAYTLVSYCKIFKYAPLLWNGILLVIALDEVKAILIGKLQF